MTRTPITTAVVLLSCFLLTSNSAEAGKKGWKEADTIYPAAPKTKSLLLVETPPTIRQKVYIDPVSLSREADWVVRYTMVIESSSGARSVFYEGIRCATEEYKSYAFLSDGKFITMQGQQWRKIPIFGIHIIRLTFMEYYFCNENNRARSAKEIIKKIKYPENLSD